MSRSRRRRPQKKEKKNTAKSALYIGVLVIAVAALGWYFFYEYSFRTDYNTTINKLDESFQNFDSKEIKDCMNSLEKLKASNSGNKERTAPIDEHLLKCYRHFADRPELSHKEKLVYLKKINSIAPDTLSELEKKLLE